MSLDYDKLDSWGLPTVTFDASIRENELNMRKDMKQQAIEMLEKAGFKNINSFDNTYGFGLTGGWEMFSKSFSVQMQLDISMIKNAWEDVTWRGSKPETGYTLSPLVSLSAGINFFNPIKKTNQAFIPLPNVELNVIAIDDDELVTDIDVKRYRNIEQVLENEQIDLAIIATPTTTHLDVSKKFLERQIHVLVEKPIALNSKEAMRLENLAL